MEVWDNIIKLPQELKNLIYAFIPMDERIKIILDSEFKIEVINSYKWGRSTMGLYSDYSDLVNIMRIKPQLSKLKKIVYHDGYTERSSKHPVMNLIDSESYYCLIGDTEEDYNAAIENNIDFIYCEYGYGNIQLKNITYVNSFSNLINVLNLN